VVEVGVHTAAVGGNGSGVGGDASDAPFIPPDDGLFHEDPAIAAKRWSRYMLFALDATTGAEVWSTPTFDLVKVLGFLKGVSCARGVLSYRDTHCC
jgi:hypothetical protein